ncbi:Tat proofreading chaperone DmsD [Mannheimia varigena]|uniref:Tat proofreading chaperone DmsD n=1 Tax=Mannheimia varigena TaxID=85404 RepID=UPI0015B59466|nr:Tat proofreading chaperone DmsD [Mannheimia varigena]MDY2946703.1 Tat proofreading chaperone DmsD [Mannheimia varigena]QLD33386.1 Tat proofreading chaperone DmsD [Mannheimia varigena]
MQNSYTQIAQFGRILGSLFYAEPNTEQNQLLVALLQNGEWQAECLFLSENEWSEIQKNLQNATSEQLNEAYQALFIGPNALPAPPWGSVYLDKESVLFGDSLLNLRAFLSDNQIAFSLNQNEPEDHIGLMLMLAAYLAEANPNLLKPFFAEHLLPWAYRFFELFNAESYPFYQGLGKLTESLLREWQKNLEIQPLVLQLYR